MGPVIQVDWVVAGGAVEITDVVCVAVAVVAAGDFVRAGGVGNGEAVADNGDWVVVKTDGRGEGWVTGDASDIGGGRGDLGSCGMGESSVSLLMITGTGALGFSHSCKQLLLSSSCGDDLATGLSSFLSLSLFNEPSCFGDVLGELGICVLTNSCTGAL